MAIEQFGIAGRNDGRLYKAVICGDQMTTIDELRKGGICLSRRINDKTLLHLAGERGFKDIARLLVEFGADPNSTYGKQQRSLLHFAAATCNFGFASVLLDAPGVNPTPRTISGTTPLHMAARTGQGFLITRLLNSGVEVNVQDNAGRTPLHLAIARGDVSTAKLLIKSGCNENTPDRYGQTPKQVADKINMPIAIPASV